jgi:hypothetical protein
MAPTHPTTTTTGAAGFEVAPLVFAVAIYGPPVLFFIVPWLLLGVMLMGPIALLLASAAAFVVAAALVAGAGALLATPYLMLRHRRAARASAPATAGAELRRVTA